MSKRTTKKKSEPNVQTKNSTKSMQIEVIELKKLVQELTADLQRIQADFVNYKRRSEEELERRSQIGKRITILSLVRTLDNFQRALAHLPKELKNNSWTEGVIKSGLQLEESLKNIGLEKISTINKQFDPELMDAAHVEGEGQKEIVIGELQSGYLLDGEILRHAVVRVKRR